MKKADEMLAKGIAGEKLSNSILFAILLWLALVVLYLLVYIIPPLSRYLRWKFYGNRF